MVLSQMEDLPGQMVRRQVQIDQLGIDDTGFAQKLIDTLLDGYPISPDRIYLTGFSNGGFLTLKLQTAFIRPVKLGSLLPGAYTLSLTTEEGQIEFRIFSKI